MILTATAPSSFAGPLGTFVVLGGGADDPTLAVLAGLLPTPASRIEILTTASTHDPALTFAAYARGFVGLGCSVIGHLEVDDAHPADGPAPLARLEAAALVFVTGGDQERLTRHLLGTRFLDVLRRRCQQEAGFVLAGTSAGASALGGQMLVEGRGWRSLLAGGIEVVPGLGLLPDVLLDQHFIERARYPRLFHAVLAHPHLLGLGLSEETGLIFRPGRPPEVFGPEVVFVVDGRGLSARQFEQVPAGQPVGGEGFRVSMLVSGDVVRW